MELIQGDCLAEMDKLIERGVKVDMILTDPPYGTTACKWDSVIPFEPMWERINKLIKPNGAVVLFGSEPFSSALRMSNIKNYRYDWVWEKTRKTGHLQAKKQPLRKHELISIFYKKQPIYNPQGLIDCNIIKKNTAGRIKSEVYGKVPSKKEHTQTKTGYPDMILKIQSEHNVGTHPTQKPVSLLEYLIKTYTNEGETVLDFTMGSGSTGVAAKNLNRNFIGIELDEDYYNIAVNRINGNN